MHKIKFRLVIVFLFIGSVSFAGIGKPYDNLYIISVGVNKYQKPFNKLEGCVSDAVKIESKALHDFPLIGKGKIFSFLYTDESATYDSIKKAFMFVSKNARPKDVFVFYFAGYSIKVDTFGHAIVPFIGNAGDSTLNLIKQSKELLSLKKIAEWMEGVQAEKQLIISEAGSGKGFANDLISELFEQNPLLASADKRDRMIVTTKGMGLEGLHCSGSDERITGGPLTYYLSLMDNIFASSRRFEYDLYKIETACNCCYNSIYSAVFLEQDYTDILVRQNLRSAGRGISINHAPDNAGSSDHIGKTYGLFIATDNYQGRPDWNDLKNPVNDAAAISEIMETKFGCQVTRIYNKPLDTILSILIKYKHVLDSNDKLLLFIAGHGYYSEDLSDGYIVLNDSKPLNADVNLTGYLPMAKLNRLLDNFKAKNIFVIFDICFGAYFDFNAKDVALNDYSELLSDITPDELIKRKDKYCSRIYLASGKSEVPDYWKNSSAHSPFAGKIISVLNEEQPFITPGIIYRKLEGNITEPYLKEFGRNDTRGDFLLKKK